MFDSKKIQKIPERIAQRFSSEHFILDLSSVVKELIENALDAKSTMINIRLKEYGVEFIELADNGLGVPREDVKFMLIPKYILLK